jgi:hypothetical protein
LRRRCERLCVEFLHLYWKNDGWKCPLTCQPVAMPSGIL